MTTPTPRWTAETEELVAIAQYRAWHGKGAPPWEDQADDVRAEYERSARKSLATLADAGVLTAVGGETRQEIEVQTTGLRYPCNDMPMAWRQFGELKAKGYDAQIVQRDVWIGPWREVTDDPA